MKSLILLIFLSYQSSAQDVYYVSHVKGKVRMALKKKALLVGQPLFLNDSLIFTTKQDYICLMSPVKGNRIARADKEIFPGKRNELVMSLKDILFPAITIVPTAARGGQVMNSLFDFKNFLASYSDPGSTFLVIDSSCISFGSTFARNPEQEYFYARYTFQNKLVTKKISFRKVERDGSIPLVLNDSIYRVIGMPVDQENVDTVQIFYYNSQKEQSYPTGTIKIRVINNAAIIKELCVIKTHFNFPPQHKNYGHNLDETLYSHIVSNYGKVDNETAERILEMLRSGSCR